MAYVALLDCTRQVQCQQEAQLSVLLSRQVIPGTDSYRFNYWGYSTVGFFAPMARYSAAAGAGQPASEVVREFKTLVKECHTRGIEVLLDVVFNHTAEGNQNGPSLSFRQAMVCSSPADDSSRASQKSPE